MTTSMYNVTNIWDNRLQTLRHQSLFAVVPTYNNVQCPLSLRAFFSTLWYHHLQQQMISPYDNEQCLLFISFFCSSEQTTLPSVVLYSKKKKISRTTFLGLAYNVLIVAQLFCKLYPTETKLCVSHSVRQNRWRKNLSKLNLLRTTIKIPMFLFLYLLFCFCVIQLHKSLKNPFKYQVSTYLKMH